MELHLCENTLGRVLDYLRRCGIEPTPEVARHALGLVEDMLAAGDDRLLERVMDELPQRFDLPEVGIPAAAPPIHRRSIGYG